MVEPLHQEGKGPGTTRTEIHCGDNSRRTRFLILGVTVALALGYMIYAAFPGNALYFLTVGEFMDNADAKDGRVIRVSGKLVEGSFQRERNSLSARFQLQDSNGGPESGNLVTTYEGVVPDLFFNPHSELVIQGSYRQDQVFQAETILVKCPSKYRSIEDDLQGKFPLPPSTGMRLW